MRVADQVPAGGEGDVRVSRRGAGHGQGRADGRVHPEAHGLIQRG